MRTSSSFWERSPRCSFRPASARTRTRWDNTLAGVVCEAAGVTAYYDLFSEGEAALRQYQAVFDENVGPAGGSFDDNGCNSGGQLGEGAWEGGRVLCFRGRGRKRSSPPSTATTASSAT